MLAEQLFNQARDLAKANHWTEACPKFEASLRYDPVLGTRLNLALCYEHIGKLATAWGLYRESIELARKLGDTKRVDYAQRQATALEPRLPKLAISAPANPPAGFVVKHDDTLVDAAALSVALYADPGPHKVTASAPGFETFTVAITLFEGKTETLTIPVLVAKPVPVPVVNPISEVQRVDTTPAVPRSKTRTYAAIGVGAAGVVATGVGVAFGVMASSTYKDATALCGSDLVCSEANYPRGRNLVKQAQSKALTSTVLIVGGVAAITAGVVLLVTAPRGSEQTAARIVPVLDDRGIGVALTGGF